MGRMLPIAVVMSAIITLVSAMALRAADATLAVVAVAALAILLTWYAQLHATEEHSAAGLANPAAAAALAVVGRRPWSTLLPVLVAHVVGGVLGGLAAAALDDQLGETLIFADPSLALACTGAALVGLLGAWATLGVDGGGPVALAGAPVVIGAAIVPLGLVAVFQPAATIGLATAGLLPWDVALAAAGITMIAAMVGAVAVSLLVPADEVV